MNIEYCRNTFLQAKIDLKKKPPQLNLMQHKVDFSQQKFHH